MSQTTNIQPRLTVAMANYNGRELLEPALESLARQTLRPARTIVIDDASTDDSVAYLREHWPQVEVIVLPRNGGATAALNAGLRAAADSELVGLFNNDVELEPDCLERLVAALDEHPDAGSATPKLLDFARRDVLDGAGDMLFWRGGATRRGHGEPDRGQYDAEQEVFGACGGAAVYRGAALAAVGGFDEAYFTYYDDVDWAFRAQLAGLRCRYVPGAVVYHRGSATLGRGITDFNGYHLWRNPIWLVAKCYPAGALLRHAPALLRGQAGNLWTAIRSGKVRVWARAMRDAARGMPAAWRRRRDVQAQRTVSLRELEARVRTGR